jgi:DNA-directed RNA polymerase subunit E'/Rpb7
MAKGVTLASQVKTKKSRKAKGSSSTSERVVLPYLEKTLTSRVELEPHDMNNEARINIFRHLKSLKENRCNRYGYVTEVTGVVSVTTAEIVPEDLLAKSVFDVKFNCILCCPSEGMTIVAQVQRMNNSLVCATNGPMLIIIQYDHINTEHFSISGGSILHRQSLQPLTTGLMIRVKIISTKFLIYDTNIKVLGRLQDLATDVEVNGCYHDHNNMPVGELKNKLQDQTFAI